MATIGSPYDFLILTNNPMVKTCMEGHGSFSVCYMPDMTAREVLIRARDMVYKNHTLYTHPLSGSVKPNETPYKSVIVSVEPHVFDAQQAEIIADSLSAFDKFPPCHKVLTEQVKRDFQLIDYSLIAGAIHFDVQAGLNSIRPE